MHMTRTDLENLLKSKGLAVRGNKVKKVCRYLDAQANGFQKKKPMTAAERQAKFKAKQSDRQSEESKLEQTKKDSERKAKYRASLPEEKKREILDKKNLRAEVNKASIIAGRPTLDTKVWEVPGKDYNFDNHEDDPITAAMLFGLNNGSYAEWSIKWDIAYLHMRKHLLSLKNEKPDEYFGMFEYDHYWQREEPLNILDGFYLESVKKMESFEQYMHETFDESCKRQAREFQEESGVTEFEDALLLWVVKNVIPSQHTVRVKTNWNIVPSQLVTPYPSVASEINPQLGRTKESLKWMTEENSIRAQIVTTKKKLKQYGYDWEWMDSLIGLPLSVPEWWWKNDTGKRYSKSDKLWYGKIASIDYYEGKDEVGYYNDGGRYYIFVCDEEEGEWPMEYGSVKRFTKYINLPDKPRKKYVDYEYHLQCNDTMKEWGKVSLAEILAPADEEKLALRKTRLERRGDVLFRHAIERVGKIMDIQRMTPDREKELAIKYLQAQGRGVPDSWFERTCTLPDSEEELENMDIGKELDPDREWENMVELVAASESDDEEESEIDPSVWELFDDHGGKMG